MWFLSPAERAKHPTTRVIREQAKQTESLIKTLAIKVRSKMQRLNEYLQPKARHWAYSSNQ
jgi:hypothetical protein